MSTPTDEDFISQVKWYWYYKDDPERYVHWNAARCADLMPEFYKLYNEYNEKYRQLNELCRSD